MARVSIYVSDELKARMTEVGDALNWSDIARPAFEAAIATFNHRKGQNMQTAIERLRASKAQHIGALEEDGKEAGRLWAANQGSFAEIQAISEIDNYIENERSLSAAVNANGKMDWPELAMHLFGSERWPSSPYVEAWIGGVAEFFEEVEDQI